MRRILQHDLAELSRRGSRVDRSLKPILDKQRDQTRMINMRVCYENRIDVRRFDRNLLIDIVIRSLFHAAVDDDILVTDSEHMTAAGHFMIRSDKGQFHCFSPPCIKTFSSTYIVRCEPRNFK